MRGLTRFGSWLRGALLAVGLALVAYFVWRTGPREVLAAFAAAGPFVPVLAALEVLAVLTDVLAFASLVGPEAAAIPARAWLRSSALSYGCLMLLPAGRAASEVARASVLARQVGAARAATAATQLQAAALVADGVISGVGAFVVLAVVGPQHHLAALLAGNVVLATSGGMALLVLVQNRRVASALANRFPRLLGALAAGEGRPYTRGVAACIWSLIGRAVQVVEYGVAVRAVGGVLDASTAVVAYSIHGVSATLGVAIPNQVGVADGAYVLFADTLGFAAAPARALALMLSIRATQVGLGLLGLLLPFVVRGAKGEGAAS